MKSHKSVFISVMSKKQSPARTSTRRAARLGVVHGLYEMDMAGTCLEDLLPLVRNQFEKDVPDLLLMDELHCHKVLKSVVQHQDTLDAAIDKALSKNWSLQRLESLLRAILRAGACELYDCHDIAPQVVISEYVALTRKFFTLKETGMVNAVLEALVQPLRFHDSVVSCDTP